MEDHGSKEVNSLIKWLSETTIDPTLIFSVTARVIDIVQEFYAKQEAVDETTLHFLLTSLSAAEGGIRERAERGLTRLMARHHTMLKKVLSEWRKTETDEFALKLIDNLMVKLASPIYFDTAVE